MKMAYDNKQLIKRKIYSLQIVNMDYIVKIRFNLLDTYNIDFEGGEFHFHDKIIYSERGMLLFFNVDNLHRVTPLTAGKKREIVFPLSLCFAANYITQNRILNNPYLS